MNITKTYVAATITAILMIAAATTTAFHDVTVLAAHGLIHITKHGTNSYTISEQMSSVSSFDTTYKVVGERSNMRAAENLIISTITDDFNSSATIGYVRTDDTATTTMDTVNATTTDTTATLPSPFATPE